MNEYSNKQKTPTLGQVEAINTLDNNVAVSASAGTGKTHVLVERFINILKKAPDAGSYKISVKNILAITYTRKAAMEMKDRIRKRLMDEYEYDNNKFWREQLEKLESAQITT
ncbi:MAG: UvrD-helicase domain-containing protein, partial [Phascolarctobacterium sp.]|nr:UvrD-helicase domain-containing protein [Phascolarctobacterium sp.]